MIAIINNICVVIGIIGLGATVYMWRGYRWLKRRGILRYHGNNELYHQQRSALKLLIIATLASSLLCLLIGIWGMQWN